ncbi:helix-turn-helix transcriptional regulator [Mesorhizobium sp. B3-1-9]|uniref:helix-turn-helix domain-containing protein n=1 Tax=Mesorhizobium sp. B3-1-9 TaxID=2589892 RepID=UPI00112961C5|nr:helix-turn-helix transcriptional regulator [Mesorhizobium sp. B3-1-9]TPI39285.1 helix-turn-helix transcriptional regulator [Mesorhizobium sp. B3-1-9]
MSDTFSMAKNPAAQVQQTYFFKEWRKHRGLNQEALADMIGLTASSISQLENGKQGFTDSTLTALAQALDCRPGDLLLWGPDAAEASTGPIRQPNEIRSCLERIDGLLPDNVAVLLSVIEGFRQANAGRSSQTRPDDQSEFANPRRESSASR